MQRKIIKQEEVKGYVSSIESIDFLDSSPVSDISSPNNTVCFAIHLQPTVYEAHGSIYSIRTDSNDTVAFNIDGYAFCMPGGEAESPLEGPLRPEYHHTDEIPSFLKPWMPEQLVRRTEEIRKKKLRGSLF